jgi:DinB superfamily
MPPTSETARIDDELHRAYEGDCWHGPPLREVLRGVTAETAARKHPALVHSIWALVNHLAAWVEVVVVRITERRAVPVPAPGDFPPVTDTSPEAWHATLAELERQQRRLRQVLAALDPTRLDEIVPGKDYPLSVMLHGTAQHFAYHAGQIALLKKLVAD